MSFKLMKCVVNEYILHTTLYDKTKCSHFCALHSNMHTHNEINLNMFEIFRSLYQCYYENMCTRASHVNLAINMVIHTFWCWSEC